ncbi:monovalent cation:proton antiporter-2 (CPA2) family protein [uncultured Ilyobacter sp.]|uniref:monovalent cation:proton antiporter-2 (CPA2) family protein n=1 Tax=uncultured Ilyobacter sp. TaxID=544433 RepID=UPI002AA870CE|nr:monovalent cation:proton antiporter-2 (CPA2) family protein [uncultured Ilyobacter sp.]
MTASAICVPFFKKLGFSSVLGYLTAGVIIGPFGFSLIGEVEEIMHFTEFGIVMMLFIDGLELKPSLLWKMRVPILGMGSFQVILSTLIFGTIAHIFVPWQPAIGIGLILSLSSTAIIIQTMKEKGLMHTSHGRSVFSILLFHDLAVIPMLALLPLPAVSGGHTTDHKFDIHLLEPHYQVFATLSIIFIIFIIGKYISKPMFRIIAAIKVREIFVAAAIGLIVGISLLMMAVGLSPALGTFIAGVVLADSEYRHEIESDIEPFKGLLLGVFFMSIGATLDFHLIKHEFSLIASITLGLIIIKWIVFTLTGSIFKMEKGSRKFFALILAQGGEFAFVLLHMSKSHSVLPYDITEALISAVAISIFISPFLFWMYEKISLKSQENKKTQRESDEIEHTGQKVIFAGFGRLGTDLGRFLISAGIRPVILDNDAANVDFLRKFGFEVYYGDVTRLDLLETAGIAEAELLLITIGEIEKSKKLVELVKKHYPNIKIVVNAHDHSSAYELMDMGITEIRRETFGTALALGQDALKVLGFDPYEAYRLMRIFRKNDEDMLPKLYKIHREDEKNYISMYQQHLNDIEKVMKLDLDSSTDEIDKSWTAYNPEI